MLDKFHLCLLGKCDTLIPTHKLLCRECAEKLPPETSQLLSDYQRSALKQTTTQFDIIIKELRNYCYTKCLVLKKV